MASFERFTLLHVPREQNEQTNLLSKLASTQKSGLNRSVIQETLYRPTIEEAENEKLPNDQLEAKKLKREVAKYTLIARCLYRSGFSYPLLRFLDPDKAKYAMAKVHEGICGMHIGARIRYYWPTLKKNCMEFIKKCDKCQWHAVLHMAPLEPLHSLLSTGDRTSQIPHCGCRLHYQVDGSKTCGYNLDQEDKKILLEKNSIISSDNDTHVASKLVAKFYTQLGIKQSFTSIEHPIILIGLRRRLKEAKGRWVQELPQILWLYHTTPHFVTQEMPFRLTYGTDVEVREIAHVKEFAAKARAVKRYDAKVFPQKLKRKDLVLERVLNDDTTNKLIANWEGLFKIAEEIGRGAYRLEHLDGKKIPRT
ncbi:hypothetical protein CR513_51812, partial [Mucuna pruriens]